LADAHARRSLADARRFEAGVAAELVPCRAAEVEAGKALAHLGALEEALKELEQLRAAAKDGGDDATRKQAERLEREGAKAESKVTRLRAQAKKDGVKLPAGAESPATSAECEELRKTVSAAYLPHAAKRRGLEAAMQHADRVRGNANKHLDDAVSAAYKTQALSSHPDKRRGAGSSHEDTLRFQRVRTAYETLRDADQRRDYIDTFDHDKFLGQQAAAAAAAEEAAAREARATERSGRRPPAPGRRRAQPVHVPHRAGGLRLRRHAAVELRRRRRR